MTPPTLTDRLLGTPIHDRGHWEGRYPPRGLPAGAEVTRFGPSPTGFVHIGGIYVAMICQSVARDSGGVFILRVEDTDRAREVPGAAAQLGRALVYFGLKPDEGEEHGEYGPYRQSERRQVYDTFVAELLEGGQAYPCFCSREDLEAIAVEQRAAEVPTGYWGEWARCRDLSPEEAERRLDAVENAVVRFRAPAPAGRRVTYEDRVRGPLELDDNSNDAVIRKADGLPTYHFAHAVDDHLMRVTTVIRGDEWISSVPLHLQLFSVLSFEQVGYAHIAPLMKLDGGNKRKLSKRKDPEANVDFYIEQGYPAEAIACYLRGLANSRLIDRPCPETAQEPIVLEQCSASGQLVDMAKLDEISRNWIGELSDEQIVERLREWATQCDPSLAAAIDSDPERVEAALSVERADTDTPRKDLAKWSDFRPKFGFMVPSLFEPVTDPADERFAPLDPEAVLTLASHVREHYVHNAPDEEWFGQIREAALAHGFAPNAKALKADPDGFRGGIRDAANVVRVLLTGSRQSPNLPDVARVLGEDEVLRRLSSLTPP